MPKVKLTRAYARFGGPGEVEVQDAETARRLQAREDRLNAKARQARPEPAVDADGRPVERQARPEPRRAEAAERRPAARKEP